MSDQPLTAAAIISYTQELEAQSARFYEALAEKYPAQRDTFAGFAVDCGKHSKQLLRTYQETITDALEAGFSFEGLSLAGYAPDTTLDEGASLSAAVAQALALEETVIAFYDDVADRSESLLATIPRTYRRVAKRRQRRVEKLNAL
jgi:rubrerythrin